MHSRLLQNKGLQNTAQTTSDPAENKIADKIISAASQKTSSKSAISKKPGKTDEAPMEVPREK